MEYPKTWDRTDKNAQKLFEQCSPFYKADEEDKFQEIFVPSIVFNVICIGILIYTLISMVLIIVKKKEYQQMKCGIKASLLFSLGSVINILNFYIRRLMFFDYPCFLIAFLSAVGFPLNLIPSMGFILLILKQCYANSSLYNKTQAQEDGSKYRTNGFLRRICHRYNETKLIEWVLICITISVLFVVIISVYEINYTMHPVSAGFCMTQYEQTPQFTILCFFIFVFTPLAMHDIHMFGKNFSFGKSLNISMVFIFIFSMSYIGLSGVPTYFCTKISRHIPVDTYIIFLSFMFNFSHITIPLIQSYYHKKHISGLVLTKKGLLKIFQDEILYKEFFEYAVKKRSVEYFIFHIEYVEYKTIFRNYKTLIDEISNSEFKSPGQDPSSNKEKKILQFFEEVYRKAERIFARYFDDKSDLELNLSGKLIKKVSNSLYEHNIYYNRYIVNGEEGRTLDYSKLNIENLFDDVHEEALDSLFLNVYSAYAKDKKQLNAIEISGATSRI